MNDQEEDHCSAEYPDKSAVREDWNERFTLQPVGVVIVRLLTEEHFQVAVRVEQQEYYEDQTGDRHQLFHEH